MDVCVYTSVLSVQISGVYFANSGPGSSVGIATDYGLGGPGSNSGGHESFRPADQPWGPPSLLYNGKRDFPWGRGGRGVGLTPIPI